MSHLIARSTSTSSTTTTTTTANSAILRHPLFFNSIRSRTLQRGRTILSVATVLTVMSMNGITSQSGQTVVGAAAFVPSHPTSIARSYWNFPPPPLVPLSPLEVTGTGSGRGDARRRDVHHIGSGNRHLIRRLPRRTLSVAPTASSLSMTRTTMRSTTTTGTPYGRQLPIYGRTSPTGVSSVSLSSSSSSASDADDEQSSSSSWYSSSIIIDKDVEAFRRRQEGARSSGKSLKQVLNVDYIDDDDYFFRGASAAVAANATVALSSSSFQKRPWIVGHRGCLYDYLENTREGFTRCAQLGCDAAELDVFLLPKCGTLIVFHGGGTDTNPGDLTDYCGVAGSIMDYTYEEVLTQLTFNPNFAEFPCPPEIIRQGKIPKLEEVLYDAKISGLHLKIELKGPGVVEPVLELVDRLDMVSQCSFSSFHLDRLAQVRALRPQKDPITGQFLYRTGALFNDLYRNVVGEGTTAMTPTTIAVDCIEAAMAVGATEVHLRYDTCTKGLIDKIHKNGLNSMAWFRGPIGMGKDVQNKFWDVGNEDETMYEALLRTGVQQMCVNKPDVLLTLLSRIDSGNNDDAVELNINDDDESDQSTYEVVPGQ